MDDEPGRLQSIGLQELDMTEATSAKVLYFVYPFI